MLSDVRALLATGLVISLSGCSAMMMRRAPDPPVRQAPSCTADNALPQLDAGLAVGELLLAVALESVDFGYGRAGEGATVGDKDEGIAPVLTVGLILGAAAHVTSALWGVRESEACRSALRHWQARPTPRPMRNDAAPSLRPGR
jgi:hypothetical protein